MKSIKLLNNPELKGYDGAFFRFTTLDGKPSVGGVHNYWYEQRAVDFEGNEYLVVWSISNQLAFDEGDESMACDWSNPDYVSDSNGLNVTDLVNFEN